MALKRLKAEKKRLDASISKGDMCGISEVAVNADNVLIWEASLDGPSESSYAGGRFQVRLEFPAEYPFKAPKAKFITKVWNPSVTEEGEICLEMLQNWRPMMYASDVLLALKSLLVAPASEDALNKEAAAQFSGNIESFKKQAKEWTSLYAAKEKNDLVVKSIPSTYNVRFF